MCWGGRLCPEAYAEDRPRGRRSGRGIPREWWTRQRSSERKPPCPPRISPPAPPATVSRRRRPGTVRRLHRRGPRPAGASSPSCSKGSRCSLHRSSCSSPPSVSLRRSPPRPGSSSPPPGCAGRPTAEVSPSPGSSCPHCCSWYCWVPRSCGTSGSPARRSGTTPSSTRPSTASARSSSAPDARPGITDRTGREESP